MNTQFAVAVHILTFLQTREGEPSTSELIASSVNTNPSLIRRILGLLAQAGLTDSKMGTGGGAVLGRKAEGITLLDVYRAIERSDIIPLHNTPNQLCPVGRNIHAAFRNKVSTAQHAFEANLKGV